MTVWVQAIHTRSGPLELVRRCCATSMFVVTRCFVERWDVVSVEQWLMALLMQKQKVILDQVTKEQREPTLTLENGAYGEGGVGCNWSALDTLQLFFSLSSRS